MLSAAQILQDSCAPLSVTSPSIAETKRIPNHVSFFGCQRLASFEQMCRVGQQGGTCRWPQTRATSHLWMQPFPLCRRQPQRELKRCCLSSLQLKLVVPVWQGHGSSRLTWVLYRSFWGRSWGGSWTRRKALWPTGSPPFPRPPSPPPLPPSRYGPSPCCHSASRRQTHLRIKHTTTIKGRVITPLLFCSFNCLLRKWDCDVPERIPE